LIPSINNKFHGLNSNSNTIRFKYIQNNYFDGNSLKPISFLKNLTELYLAEITKVNDFTPIGKCVTLQKIFMFELVNLQDANFAQNLHQLKQILIECCHKLECIKTLKDLPELNMIKVLSCSIKHFPDFRSNVTFIRR